MATFIFKVKVKNYCDHETPNMTLNGKWYESQPIQATDLDEAAEIWATGYDDVEELINN